jgi:hypothetical protein
VLLVRVVKKVCRCEITLNLPFWRRIFIFQVLAAYRDAALRGTTVANEKDLALLEKAHEDIFTRLAVRTGYVALLSFLSVRPVSLTDH